MPPPAAAISASSMPLLAWIGPPMRTLIGPFYPSNDHWLPSAQA